MGSLQNRLHCASKRLSTERLAQESHRTRLRRPFLLRQPSNLPWRPHGAVQAAVNEGCHCQQVEGIGLGHVP